MPKAATNCHIIGSCLGNNFYLLWSNKNFFVSQIIHIYIWVTAALIKEECILERKREKYDIYQEVVSKKLLLSGYDYGELICRRNREHILNTYFFINNFSNVRLHLKCNSGYIKHIPNKILINIQFYNIKDMLPELNIYILRNTFIEAYSQNVHYKLELHE